MKTRYQMVSVTTAGLLALGLSACGDANEESSTEATTISVSHVESSSSITHSALESVAERVEDRTNGELVLDIYPDGQLGTSTDTLQQSAADEPIIGYTDAAELAELAPDSNLDILSGPFLFDNTQQSQTFHESDVFQDMKDNYADESGVQILSLNYFLGTRNMIGQDAYPNPSDMNGVKLRVPPIESWTRTAELLGASPTTVDYTEVYSALQQGVVDAAEGDVNSLLEEQWGEEAQHLTMTHHFQLFLGFAMGADTFDELTKEQQDILVEEFERGGVDSSEENAAQEDASITELEEMGVTVHEADLDAYREATSPYYDEYPDDLLTGVRDAASE